MTTPISSFPRYFKGASGSIILRFDHHGFGTFTNTEQKSDYWHLDLVLEHPELWTETQVEAIALLTARNGGGE